MPEPRNHKNSLSPANRITPSLALPHQGGGKSRKGQSLLEVIIALGVFGIGVVAAASLLMLQFGGVQSNRMALRASLRAEEGLEAVRTIRNRDWFALRPGQYGLALENNQWTLSPTPDESDGITRTINITTIDETARQITSTVAWAPFPGRQRTHSQTMQLTDWRYVGEDGLSGDWENPIVTTPELDLEGGGTGVAVRDRIAYMSVSTYRDEPDFYIIDVVNPEAPFVISSVHMNDRGTDDVALYGNHAYLASRDDGYQLHVVDITDPENPALVSSLSLPGFEEASKTVAIDFPYAYVGTYSEDDYGEFWVIDISNPAAPTPITSLETDSSIQDIFLRENLAFVAAGEDDYGEFFVVDISNPAAPIVIGEYDPRGNNAGYGVSLVENIATLVRREGNPELMTLDISDPTDPVLLGSARSQEHFHKVLTIENLAFATRGHSPEFQIYDLTNPTNPVMIREVDLRTAAEGMDFLRNYLYAAVRSSSRPLAIITAE